MKILLVGEYSRLHNSLKEGLQELGHEVALNGLNDGFKNYPVDFKIKRKWNSGILKKLKLLFLKCTGFDITSYLTYRQVKNNLDKFSGFDVVQLINENSFLCVPKYEIKIINLLLKNNQKLFLLSCGNDYLSVTFNFKNPELKTEVTSYLEGKILDENFQNTLKFKQPDFKKLHDFIFKNCCGVIASDLDYYFPLLNHPKFSGLIPNPININKLIFTENPITDKIVIFLGINNQTYYKKGCDYFEKALTVIQSKYPDKVKVIISRSVPYATYINSYNECHILLDQIYAKDQGYNALEAMAKGKVVFTGAGDDFVQRYNLTEKVAIHAKDDIEYLVNELSFLIENPNEIIKIQKNARLFIEQEHNYVGISKKYISTWNTNKKFT